jgi:hypothetical protein
MLYAAHSPHLFRAAASFSGVLDTLNTSDWQFPPKVWGRRTQQPGSGASTIPPTGQRTCGGSRCSCLMATGIQAHWTSPGPPPRVWAAKSSGGWPRETLPLFAGWVSVASPRRSTRTGLVSMTGRTGSGNCTERCPASCVLCRPDPRQKCALRGVGTPLQHSQLSISHAQS